MVLATGGGKTICAAAIIHSAVSKGSRVLFLAHRRELIKQAFCKLVRFGVDPSHAGILMPDSHLRDVPDPATEWADDADLWRRAARLRPSAAVQVASIQTIARRALPPADLVFVDEAHRACSPSYMRLLGHYDRAVHIGLTATPWRGDGKGLNEYYQDLVVLAKPSELIDLGFILEPRVFTVPREDLPDLSGVRIVGGDYDEVQLSAAVDQETLVGNIVEHWERQAVGMRTAVFPASVAHSRHICTRFTERGHKFEHIDGNMPARERDAILCRLEAHEIDGVSSCDVLSEGWDMPSAQCAILARPTESATKLIQQCGRVLRPCQGKGQPIILDHAGNVLRLGLPHEDRDYSIAPPEKKGDSKAPSVKSCPECLALLPSITQVCPVCSYSFSREGDEVKPDKTSEADGDLVEVRAATQDEKRSVWDSLCRASQSKGYKIGWARYQYKARFGSMPPNSFGAPRVDTSSVSSEDKLLEWNRFVAIGMQRGYKPGWAMMRYRGKFDENPPVEFFVEETE